ncbi:MAG: XdhC family protein [Firmicutes bacterium]|nr:XdhC family protein [Bacillota bacterium]
MDIGMFYKLVQGEANEGESYLTTVTRGKYTGSKALWHDGGLLAVYPDQSAAFWQAQQVPESGYHLVASTYQGEECEIFFEPLHGGDNKLVICGGGHVSLPVAQLGTMLGFEVTVIDDRSFFANNRRFPDAQVMCMSFSQALPHIRGKNNYYVIVTRGQQFDIECLRILLKNEYAYLGMIGSKTRVKNVRETMAAEGYDKQKIDAMHSPIGLRIGAETPEEIAVAIMAEIIQVRSARGGASGSPAAERALSQPPAQRRALVTILRRRGSAPRSAGTKMIVQEDGSCIGTVGGGYVESGAIEKAQTVIQQGICCRYTVDITGSENVDEENACGGIVDLLIEPLQ